jgi:hypothetical protein
MAERELNGAPDAEPETDSARITRNWNELLQELRVSQTGVQILFAFLLGVSFTDRFTHATGPQIFLYFVSLLATAGATALLIAPVSYHRLLFRQHRRPELVRAGNRFAIAGLALVAVGTGAAVAMVADVVLGEPWGWVIGGALGAWYVLWWYLVPLVRRLRHPELARNE